MTRFRTIRQPGPPRRERIASRLCTMSRVDVRLDPDITLDQSIARALERASTATTAWIEVADAQVATLSYVIPDRSPDGKHMAGYSAVQPVAVPGTISRSGITVGKQGTDRAFHAHGLYRDADGRTCMGHLLPEHTRLMQQTRATAWVTTGADFVPDLDPETEFPLLQPKGGQQTGDAAILRIAPNQDIVTALDTACGDLGWASAKVRGLGSLIDVHFEDGAVLDSFATEFLFLDADAHADHQIRTGPEICVVGFDGAGIRTGRLLPGRNPTLITAEIFMERRT